MAPRRALHRHVQNIMVDGRGRTVVAADARTTWAEAGGGHLPAQAPLSHEREGALHCRVVSGGHRDLPGNRHGEPPWPG